MVLPTRTSPLPDVMAPTKSSLMPMLSSSGPAAGWSVVDVDIGRAACTRSRCSRSATKSGFSMPAAAASASVARLRAMAPIVMRPSSRRCGHSSTMVRHSATVSSPGAQPDLLSSPDVFTWTCTWMGGRTDDDDDDDNVCCSRTKAARAASSSLAFLAESMLETHHKLGMRARPLQWPISCQHERMGRTEDEMLKSKEAEEKKRSQSHPTASHR
ncbi:hypothetical protein CMQ_351 [Grosmannia clavigera kw1407]|uniref:Uncharacterized protein n=1 Tax=Grosmannia clavigera (strain kw1407 / UAMH 11150) TaxID=655863 RepID=F0XD40_GROCL|nr:uncharacterized protein CMQ_351 [Grosmannia clavigera kw1407]EFX03423.1 hypothetical protein CMQ_351 [Grosmannia clavigera kw1407]